MRPDQEKVFGWSLGMVAGLLVLGLILAAGHPVEALEKEALRRALLATVHIAAPISDEEDVYSTGSGSMLTSEGHILTNFHVVGDTDTGQLTNPEGLAFVAVNPPDLRGLPTWAYQATFVRGDPYLDLAVLKISAPFKGVGGLADGLGLVTMATGDSDSVEIGDAVSAIGFPSIGGDSVTLTGGTIAGFLDEDIDGKADWFKTDAEVNRGNSGGAAVNEAGELIGVPTAGISDVEAAGKISLVRPLNLASPLIKAATSEITVTSAITATGVRRSSIVLTDKIDRRGQPGGAATQFRSDTGTVYANFVYEGFENGLFFEAKWTRDGAPVDAEGWVWAGGESGSDWVSISEKPDLTDGTYELVLSLAGVPVGVAQMTVGAAVSTTGPKFSALVFAEDVSTEDEPVRPHDPHEPFLPRTAMVVAFFEYVNMTDGTPWSYHWTVDGEALANGELSWSGGESGTTWVRLSSNDGLPGGRYRLELRIGNDLAAEGAFDLGDAGSLIRLSNLGVQLLGVILDADTQRPIPGATIIALNPGIGVQAFLRKPDERSIHAWGEADTAGHFSLSRSLTRGVQYTLLVGADGYQMATEENYTIDASAASPREITIELQTRQ